MATEEELFKFGVVADVQYADHDNWINDWGVERHFRDALLKLEYAVKKFEADKVAFVINLGDSVDRRAKDYALRAITEVYKKFQLFSGPVYSVFGNHETYILQRSDFIPLMNIPHDGSFEKAWYSFSPHKAFRFVAMDSYDIALKGRHDQHERVLLAEKMLKEGMETTQEKHYVNLNGGVSEEQLEWLASELRLAQASNQHVVIFTHVPFNPDVVYNPDITMRDSITWNYRDIVKVLQAFPRHLVVCCLYGHEHMGGYAVDSYGIPHLALEAIVETPVGTEAFAIGHVFMDRIELRGYGRVRSVTFPVIEYQSQEAPV